MELSCPPQRQPNSSAGWCLAACGAPARVGGRHALCTCPVRPHVRPLPALHPAACSVSVSTPEARVERRQSVPVGEALVTEVLEQVRPVAERAAREEQQDPEQPASCRLALVTVDLDGVEHAGGDADELFPIQSVAKVFALTLALQRSATSCGIASARSPRATPTTAWCCSSVSVGSRATR